MKQYLLMTLMAFLSFSIHLGAQETLDVKLDYSNARLSDVLNDFTRQTGITFSYEVTLGNMMVPQLEADLKNASLDACLEAVFGHLGITYKVDGRVVALSMPDNVVKKDTVKKKVTVTGVVSDASGLPLPGAVVMVTDGPIVRENANNSNAGSVIGMIRKIDGNSSIKVIISDCVAGNGGTVDGAAPTVALAIKEGTGNATISNTTVGGDRPSDL